MSDTWSNIQAHKKQLDSLRERVQRRRKDPGQLGAGGEAGASAEGAAARSDSPAPAAPCPPGGGSQRPPDPELEKRLLGYLSDLSLSLPTESLSITADLSSADAPVTHSCIQSLLLKFSAQELIEVRQPSQASSSSSSTSSTPSSTLVVSVDHTKLWAMTGPAGAAQRAGGGGVKRKAEDPAHHKRPPGSSPALPAPPSPPHTSSISLAPAPSSLQMAGGSSGGAADKKSRAGKGASSHLDMEIESLLNQQSTKEQQSKKVSREILELLNTSTAKEQTVQRVEEFVFIKEQGGASCSRYLLVAGRGTLRMIVLRREKERIINKHTDESLGDCSFLNTCFHMDTCKYVHYEIDSPPEVEGGLLGPQGGAAELGLHPDDADSNVGKLFPSQWICCDIRYLDVSILGKFAVVMADPPWDIHMELPYGTLTDDEMRKLHIPLLQDDGFLFLWVTGRAMELGRECLSLWGYDRVDEIIWVKTNQLQRIIRTGRTGHWLNHGKEHCLVGVKGSPQGFNRGLDCDVIVAEVRSTSHKPDEIYGMIERLSPGTRKIELFGRPHNVQPNWVTLGNQLDGIHLLDPDVVARFKKRYPDGVISKPKSML
ncbi:unnamed protein product [Arctogadus glacialis]